MKKKLSQAQQDILALTVVQGAYRIDAGALADVAALVVAGHVAADTGMALSLPVSVQATTKGVRVAVRDKIALQHGTRFNLPANSKLEMQTALSAFAAPSSATQPLRLVPPKPRDPFDEGFTAAKDGQPASNTWQDQTQASEYDEGFRQGAMWRAQNPPAASA